MPDQNQNVTGQQQSNQAAATPPPASFDEWLEKNGDETAKSLFKAHVAKLENTVTATREERDAAHGQLKNIKKLFGTDPEKAKAELDRMERELGDATRKASFLEEASDPTLKCLNPKAAWALAISGNFFRASGQTDWAALKEIAPQIFGDKPAPKTDAGNGTAEKQKVGTGLTMNDLIRRKASGA
jgi:hypothetical protein